MVELDLSYQFLEKLKLLPFVEAIYLYGSRARGDHRERSDIDLAILCPEATRQEWNQVIEIIEEADTLLSIDCVRLDQLGEGNTLLHNIVRDRKALYIREEI